MERDARQSRAEHRDDRQKHDQCGAAAAKRTAPATHAADGEDNGQRLDAFDQ
jgi:hypothetical protein